MNIFHCDVLSTLQFTGCSALGLSVLEEERGLSIPLRARATLVLPAAVALIKTHPPLSSGSTNNGGPHLDWAGGGGESPSSWSASTCRAILLLLLLLLVRVCDTPRLHRTPRLSAGAMGRPASCESGQWKKWPLSGREGSSISVEGRGPNVLKQKGYVLRITAVRVTVFGWFSH